jgi:hypothetical protein|tara:strand:+ start:8685 stop:9605 length:921 start_codon:yes stop_codon:yes gene_type:complete
MANENLETIIARDNDAGPFGSRDAVKEQVLRDFIQLQSKVLAIGTDLVGTRTVPWLEFTWYTGVSGAFTYPIDDSATVGATKIGTKNYSVQLKKGMGRVTFLDSTLLRGETFENMNRQQLGVTQALADTIDNLILSGLHAGAGDSVAATAAFGSSTADEEKDILSAADKIFDLARVSGNETLSVVLPAVKRSALLNTQLFGNVIQSLQDHLKGVLGMDFKYTRDDGGTAGTDSAIGVDALVMVPGAQTAEFFQYNGAGFRETELTRLPGVGFDWMLTGYMGMVVHEHQDGASAGTTKRIVKITGVQ